jgi:hypothetical protein
MNSNYLAIVRIILAPHVIAQDCARNESLCYSSIGGTGQHYGRSQMGELDNCRVEGISSYPHVHGDEKTTQYEVLLGESGIFLSLPHHL